MRPVPRSRLTGGMGLSQLPVLAGALATAIFVGSYLPMLVRAVRTRDLSSYSRSSLVLAYVGNVVQTAYVVALPLGPIWGLHTFYLLATLMMLVLHLRHVRPAGRRAAPLGAVAAPGDGCVLPRDGRGVFGPVRLRTAVERLGGWYPARRR